MPKTKSTTEQTSRSRADHPNRRGSGRAFANAYLGGRRTPLTREREVELARTIVDAERAILEAVLACPTALREFAAAITESPDLPLLIGGPGTSKENADAVLERGTHALRRAAGSPGRLGPRKRAEIMDAIGRSRLHPRLIDRVSRALRARRDAQSRGTLATIRGAASAAGTGRRELVEHNIGLVLITAKRYMPRGLELLDLVQEGSIGLMRAIDKFDPDKNIRFSTYSTWWIRHHVQRTIADRGRTIRIPVHQQDRRRRVAKTRQSLGQLHGRAPTIAEVARAMELTEAQIRALDEMAPEPISLQAPVANDAVVGDFAADDKVAPALETVAGRRMTEEISGLLEHLSPREREILSQRYGLGGSVEHTLQEIGQQRSLSRERIRQIEAEALAKLRALAKRKHLDSYLAA